MALVIAMTHLVAALKFSIQIMFQSCLMVFTDLKHTKFERSNFYIQQNSRLCSATDFVLQ